MENIVIFVMVILLLIWVVSVIYTLFVSSPYKRDDNLDFGEIDIEQAKQIWKEKLEYPYCKSIYTNEEGNLDITSKYATYKVKFKDGKMVIEDKAKPFAKPGNVVEEKDCLEAYLVKLLLPETDINTPRALGHFRKYIKARIIRRISGWLFFIVLILYAFHTSGIHLTDVTDIWNSKGVSMMQLTEYSDEITIGEALRTACPKGKWKSNKIDKGLYRVVFNGYGMNGSLLTMVFQSQDWSQCTIQSIAIDEQDYTLFGGLFLEALFANAGNAADIGNAEEQGFLQAIDEYIDEGAFTSDGTEALNGANADLSEQLGENDDDSEMELSVDEDLYDSEVQGFSDGDESGGFLYESNGDIDYLGTYSSMLEEICCSYDDYEYCEYTLYDLDKDGIKELITSEGTCDADWINVVYTLEEGQYVSMVGQFYGSVMLYVAEDGNGLYAVQGHMGSQSIDQITKNGSQLHVETIMSGEIGVEEDYYSNDNPVSFTTVTDDSLLRQ